MSNEKTYEDGVREGEIVLLKKMSAKHESRLDAHAQRLQRTERLIYAVGGALALLQFLPSIQKLIGGG